MDTKSKKYDNKVFHVPNKVAVDQQKRLTTPNTAKPIARSTHCNDMNGSQKCKNNVLHAADVTVVRNISKTPHEATSPSSQNDTKEVKHSLKDQIHKTGGESVDSEDSNTFKKCNIQVGNKNIMRISKQSKTIHCQQSGNKNIMIYVQVNSNQFKQADIDGRESEGEVWLEIKRRLGELIGIDTESNDRNDVLDVLKDDLLNSDCNKNMTLDCSSFFHEGDSHSTPLEYLEAEEEGHYATIDIVERKDSLRIKFGKNNQPNVLNIDNLAESTIMAHQKVLDFLEDNGNDFDVTITDWENDSEYDFIPSFAVESDPWNEYSHWSNEQKVGQRSHPSEGQSQMPPVPRGKALSEAFKRVNKGYDGENERQRKPALLPKSMEEISPEGLRLAESQLSTKYGPPPMPAKRSRYYENVVLNSQPLFDNITGNGSIKPDTNQRNDFVNQISHDTNGKQSSEAGSVVVTKKGNPGPMVAPKQKIFCLKDANPRQYDVNADDNITNGELPSLEASSADVTKKSKPKIAPKPKIRLPSENIEVVSIKPDTNQRNDHVNQISHDTNGKQSSEAGSVVVTKKCKPGPMIAPKPKILRRKDFNNTGANPRQYDVNTDNNVTNGELPPLKAGSADVTRKSKPKIAPKPKIRLHSENMEVGSIKPDTNQRNDYVNQISHDTNGKQSSEAGSIVVTKKRKPGPMIYPKPKILRRKDSLSDSETHTTSVKGHRQTHRVNFPDANPRQYDVDTDNNVKNGELPPLEAGSADLTKKKSINPDTNQRNAHDNQRSPCANGKQSSEEGALTVTKKCKPCPIIAPKPKILHQKAKDVTNGELPHEAGSADVTKKSKTNIAPEPKIRVPSENMEAGIRPNTENTQSIATSLLKPTPVQQGLAIYSRSLLTTVNSQKIQCEKEMNDSIPKMNQDRDSPMPVAQSELVDDSGSLERCPIRSKTLLDLVTCYSNVKEFKREEYMNHTGSKCSKSPMKEMPCGTFLVRPGISTKMQVLVVKASTGGLHKFQIHEKHGLLYLVKNDMFPSIDELVQYYSFVTLPSSNFRNVLERGINSR